MDRSRGSRFQDIQDVGYGRHGQSREHMQQGEYVQYCVQWSVLLEAVTYGDTGWEMLRSMQVVRYGGSEDPR